MKKLLLIAFLVACIHAPVRAQEDIPVIFDTVVTEEGDEEERAVFLPLDSFDNNYNSRAIPDSIKNGLLEEDAYWYANTAPEREKKGGPRRSLNAGWVKTVLWFLIIGCFLAVMAWWLFTSDISLFRRPSTSLRTDSYEEQHEDIFSIDYDREIGIATAAGNFRLATRLLYLKTLRNLADRKYIDYRQERTNSDYLLQLSASPLYQSFWKLTRNYEYTWYGQFDLSAETFALVQQDFINFNSRVA